MSFVEREEEEEGVFLGLSTFSGFGWGEVFFLFLQVQPFALLSCFAIWLLSGIIGRGCLRFFFRGNSFLLFSCNFQIAESKRR